jgi:hypothetical protein
MNRQEAYFILIATFILVLAWIIFSILDSAVNSTISQTLTVQITSISPTFDTNIIEGLKKRQQVIPLDVEPVQQATSSVKPVSFTLQDSPLIKKATSSGIVQEQITP